MTIDLKDYLTRRHQVPSKQRKPGPVITISREYGCDANTIAEKLANSLGKLGPKWTIINREILEESSRKLNVNPIHMEHAFTPHERNFVQEMFKGFAVSGVPDKKVYKIIRDVIHSYAQQGHTIIIGRGGVAITRDIEKSLHIRLIAPEDYRARLISEKRKITLKRAKEITLSQDQRRRLYIQKLRGESVDNTIFDLLINRVTVNDQEIIDTILALGKSRKLF